MNILEFATDLFSHDAVGWDKELDYIHGWRHSWMSHMSVNTDTMNVGTILCYPILR